MCIYIYVCVCVCVCVYKYMRRETFLGCSVYWNNFLGDRICLLAIDTYVCIYAHIFSRSFGPGL